MRPALFFCFFLWWQDDAGDYRPVYKKVAVVEDFVIIYREHVSALRLQISCCVMLLLSNLPCAWFITFNLQIFTVLRLFAGVVKCQEKDVWDYQNPIFQRACIDYRLLCNNHCAIVSVEATPDCKPRNLNHRQVIHILVMTHSVLSAAYSIPDTFRCGGITTVVDNFCGLLQVMRRLTH